jgi:hypothetical protein
MAIRGVLKSTLAAVALTAVGISLVSCGRDLVGLNERVLVKEGKTLNIHGGGCTTMQLGSSRPIAPSPVEGSDFEVTEGTNADVVVVQVFSDTELLANRQYDEAMLRSGTVDEFTVTTHAGRNYVLRHWGGSCASFDATIDSDSGQ